MQLSRQHRLIAALIALVSMLFVQLAVAAYACPSRQIAQAVDMADMGAMAAQADEHEHMNGCADADGEKSALCHAHCQPDTQSLDKPPLPDVSPFMALALVSTVIDSGTFLQPIVVPSDDLFLSRSTSPPLSIQNCCFRI